MRTRPKNWEEIRPANQNLGVQFLEKESNADSLPFRERVWTCGSIEAEEVEESKQEN